MYRISKDVFGPIAESIAAHETALLTAVRSIEPQSASFGLSVDLALAYQFFENLVGLTGNSDIGLKAYGLAWPGRLGVPGYAIMSSPTLRIALERLARYNPLFNDCWTICVEQHEGVVVIRGLATGIKCTKAPRAILEAGAAMILGLVHWLAPYTKPMPLEIKLPYVKPDNVEELVRIFGHNLVFESTELSMKFSSYAFNLPLLTASPQLESVHCQYADAMVTEYIVGSFAARARFCTK
ncbi:AraC family transcriptional regulator ligand-binding domain-containing protein, partial [Pseudomonas coronafaciens]|uniref:AraC family transcriptional regulator ligand-binding domain-containing protein n=1 Tax=Pseudomonas coronafaciens TaxID=53409 RepID=UPI0006ABD276